MYFEISVLGNITNLLGVQHDRHNGQIVMHQRKFIDDLTDKFDCATNLNVKMPVSSGNCGRGKESQLPY